MQIFVACGRRIHSRGLGSVCRFVKKRSVTACTYVWCKRSREQPSFPGRLSQVSWSYLVTLRFCVRFTSWETRIYEWRRGWGRTRLKCYSNKQSVGGNGQRAKENTPGRTRAGVAPVQMRGCWQIVAGWVLELPCLVPGAPSCPQYPYPPPSSRNPGEPAEELLGGSGGVAETLPKARGRRGAGRGLMMAGRRLQLR